MILDRGVFNDNRVPEQLLHRDGEVDAIAQALRPTIRGNRGSDILISGPSGVGKTALAKFSLRHANRHNTVEWHILRVLLSLQTKLGILGASESRTAMKIGRGRSADRILLRHPIDTAKRPENRQRSRY